MKKMIALLLSVLMLCSALTGCGQKAPKEDEPVTLNFLTWRSEDVAVYEKINAEFEKLNPNIKINMDTKTANEDEYYAVLKTKLGSKSESVDVFAIHEGQHLLDVSATGKMLDLNTTNIPGYYVDSYVERAELDGKLYGVPQGLGSYVGFYNKGIFDELGLTAPTTWDDLVNVVTTLRENNYKPMVAGLNENWLFELLMYPWFMAYNPDMPDILGKLEAGEIEWTDDRVMNVFKDVQEAGKIGLFHDGAEGTKYEQSLSLFAQGDAGMLLTGIWSIGGLKVQAPDIEQGYFMIPNTANGRAINSDLSQLYAINADSPNKDAAIKYLEFLSTPEMQKIYAEDTIQPSAAKDLKMDMPEMQRIQDVLATPDAVVGAAPHLVCKNAKFVTLLQTTAAKAYMGENIEELMQQASDAAEAMR